MDLDPHSRSPVFRLGSSLASASAMAERSARWVRLIRAAVAVTLVMAIGTWGYWYLSDGEHTVVQALYMTVISVSTVGFNEVIPIENDTMRIFTMGLILFGGASVVYFLTAVAAFLLEGDFLYGFWRRRLRAGLARARDHVIVVGLGRVGSHAFDEIHRSGLTVVGIDREPARVERLIKQHGPRILFMVGDGADEELLRGVGVGEASTLVAALADDRDNFLLCVTARQLNPEIRLMVRLVDPGHAAMFDELAADAVVYPPALSGVRLANELLHPELTEFTDHMLEADAKVRALVEVVVPPGSPLIGRRVGALSAEANVSTLILGVRPSRSPRDATFPFGPSWDHRLAAGDTLLVLGVRRERNRLAKLLETRASKTASSDGARETKPTEVLPVLKKTRAEDGVRLGGEPRTSHVVVVGAGAVGRSAVQEILRQDIDVTVIDRMPRHLAMIEAPAGPHHGGDDGDDGDARPRRPSLVKIQGDVGEPSVLARAGLEDARGFITALQPLRDNLFLAASLHLANRRARVVARVGNEAEARRLHAVGAAVVNPGRIGGIDIAHRTVRPELVEFARGLEISWDHPEQLAVVPIRRLPERVRSLRPLAVRERTGCLILGYRKGDRGPFHYHPHGTQKIRAGGQFVALGEPSQIAALYGYVNP